MDAREFVEGVVRALVNYPDEVAVTRQADEMGVLVNVKVNPADMGLVIGRAGVTAKAIRTIAKALGMRDRARVSVKIEEPEGYERPERTDYRKPEKTRSVNDVVSDLGN